MPWTGISVAGLYGVEPRTLNQAVKRNLERFPEDFMFRLSAGEWEGISSQFVMTFRLRRPKSSLPYAFTEHGVVMLSSVQKAAGRHGGDVRRPERHQRGHEGATRRHQYRPGGADGEKKRGSTAKDRIQIAGNKRGW